MIGIIAIMQSRDIENKLEKSGAMSIDYVARNKKSRQRGYDFENWLVKEVSAYPYWGSRRLGGSSTGLPDVMMSFAELVPANNKEDPDLKKWKTIIVATECKEGEDNYLYVEREQVRRAYAAITQLWQSIDDKWILLAFKFLRNKTQYKARTQTLQRYILIPYSEIAEWLKQYYDTQYVKILFRYDIRKEELNIMQYDSNSGNKAIITYKSGQDYEMFDNVAELIGYVQHV